MESFYGGKQGASFTIKETFNSVEEMEIAFRGGDTYKKVAYGEHVLITGNELNEEYGNIYRRGYDGAELVGNFRGPQGTPFKFQGTYDKTKTYYNNNKQIDLVYYDKKTFIRIGDTDAIVGVLPMDERHWSLFLESKPGTTWYNGGTITGTNYFGEIFPNSGVSYANQNDFYFNTNTTSIYIAMNEGTPDVVMWRYVITLASQVNTDETLSIQGAAADAAKVGQEIETLNFSLSNLISNKVDLHDFYEHKNNSSIHLSEEDREKLDNFDGTLGQDLEQHLLTIENLNNIKPDNYTCYCAYDNNTIINVPIGYEGKAFSMLAYKTSKDYRVQEYTSKEGEKLIRYCTHNLTEDNLIDDNGFNWGVNGQDLCRNKPYYVCCRNSAEDYFIIYSDNLIQITDNGTSGYFLNTTNTYILDKNTGIYSKYNSGHSWYPEQLMVRTFSGSNWFNMLFYYSNQNTVATIPGNTGAYGSYTVQYGTGQNIIDIDTNAGWNEWQDMKVAKYINYDNTTSGLVASDVQTAIDEFIDETKEVLDLKPENVSQLFNFNKYDGDINSLAVGMYVYHKGNNYASNGVDVTVGSFEGWCRIQTIYTDTGYCYVNPLQLFGKQSSGYTSPVYVKPENFSFVLTEEEAKYLGMLSSVWGATQGGLTTSYAEKLSGGGTSYSFSLYANQSFIAIGFVTGAGLIDVFIGSTYSDNTSGGAVKMFSNVTNSTMSVAKSGSTITLSSAQSTTRWNIVKF